MNASTTAPQPAALEGLRIIDFSQVFQGPVGTQLLADFGADVIKVERPGSGDWSRAWGPYVGNVSLPFATLNRNKRSVTLDLRTPQAKEVALRLIATADVLVHNFRPGVMERLGLGYEQLAERYPWLVYAYSSGWGDEGPCVERGRGGHDMLARASAGWFAPLGPDGLPVPAGMSADYPAGLLLMQAVLIALLARERTGRGQFVSTDLLSAAIHAHSWEGAPSSTATAHARRHRAIETAIDKSFRSWTAISRSLVQRRRSARHLLAMGLETSPRPALCPPIEGQRPRDERHPGGAPANVGVGRHPEPQGALWRDQTLAEAPRTAGARQSQVIEMEHPTRGRYASLARPSVCATPLPHRRRPTWGSMEEVLAEIGYSQKIIHCAPRALGGERGDGTRMNADAADERG